MEVRKALNTASWYAVDISKKNTHLNQETAHTQPDLHVIDIDLLSPDFPDIPVDIVVAKDSMNNMDDKVRACYVDRLRRMRATYFFANCDPTFGGRQESFVLGAEDVYIYRKFNLSRCGLSFIKSFYAPEEESHPAVWTLYRFWCVALKCARFELVINICFTRSQKLLLALKRTFNQISKHKHCIRRRLSKNEQVPTRTKHWNM